MSARAASRAFAGASTPKHVFDVVRYGADPTNTVDSTAAVQAALNAAEAFAIASPYAYAVVRGIGVFKIAGAFKTTASGNSQLTLPVRAVASNKLTIQIGELADAASMPHWQQTSPQLTGFVLKSTMNSADFSGTSNEGSVLGGPTPANGYGRSALYSNVNVVIRGVQVQVPMTTRGADTWGIDLRGMANAHLSGVAAYTDATPPTITRGAASGWACGIALPTPGNNDLSIADNCSVEGFTYGIYAGEHVTSNRSAAIYCYIGVLAGAFWSSVGQQHPNIFTNLSVEACSVGVQVTNGGKIVIELLSTEGSMNHVVDATGAATGYIGLAGIISAINVSDPTNIKVIYLDGKSGNYTAPAIPASTVAFRNPAWRDATVAITGGTVTGIAIDGVSQGLTSGVFRLPSGRKITLTYTVAPTWVWTLD